MLLCLSLRKTRTAPVGEDKSILVRLHNHPVGGGDEVPLGVILLVAVRLVVVGARGGLESDAILHCHLFVIKYSSRVPNHLEGGVLHQILSTERQREKAA